MATLRLARPARGDMRAVEGLDEMLVVKPAYESCAKAREDCLNHGAAQAQATAASRPAVERGSA